jgi:hypothetical protein
MKVDDLDFLIEECKKEFGSENLVEKLRSLLQPSSEDEPGEMTVIANRGVHHLPDYLIRGELFVLSEGSLDFSTPDSAKKDFEACLKVLSIKLKSKRWKRVYLVPFGPTLLSAFVKLLVFRVTGLETVDIMHMGGGTYADIEIDIRRLILEADSS